VIGIFLWVIGLLAHPLEAGDTLWTRTYGGLKTDVGYAVQQTSDGGYIIAGYTNSFGTGDWDIYLIRTDKEGDTLWTKTYGGIGSDMGFSVQQTSDGGYIITGGTESFGAGDLDVYLMKIRPDVGIREDTKDKMQEVKLHIYPNPSNQKIVISYSLSAKREISLKVYDISGRLVRTLLKSKGLEPRVYRVIWDRRDDLGKKVREGIYFLRLETEKQTLIRKLVIIM